MKSVLWPWKEFGLAASVVVGLNGIAEGGTRTDTLINDAWTFMAADVAGAEAVATAERNMSSAVMRGTATLPGSNSTSRAKGARRNLGGPALGRQRVVRRAVRIGKVRSRSR